MATDSDGVHVFSPPELVSCQFEPCSGLWAFPCLLQVLGRSHCTLGKGKELHNRGRYAAPDAPCRSFLPQHEAMIRPGAASAATRASVLQRHIAARSILVSYRSTLVASRACHALFRTFGGTGIFVRNLSHETVLRRRLDFIIQIFCPTSCHYPCVSYARLCWPPLPLSLQTYTLPPSDSPLGILGPLGIPNAPRAPRDP